MKVYKIERVDRVSYCEDYACIVCADGELWAEKIARQSSTDFRKAKLKVTEIDLEKEGVLLTANTGA